MARKVHPKSFRIHETGLWESRWFDLKRTPALLAEDFAIRSFLEKRLKEASIAAIEIERFSGKINIILATSRPGMVIGRGGAGLEELRRAMQKIVSAKEVELQIK